MEALEFLGGKYQKPELIVSGPVQTFRAKDSATSRFVFAHRVSMAEEPTEQTALLRLLTTGMVRSPEVRKLVLDFGEEEGFWYVVTQPEPQCILLRQWLQSEMDGLDAGAASKKVASKPGEEPAQKPEPTAPEPTKPPPVISSERASPAVAEPSKPAIPKAEKPKEELGEFTRMFRASSQEPVKPMAPMSTPQPEKPAKAEPPKPEERKNEPGEFTRIFQATSQSPAKPASPAGQSKIEQPKTQITEQVPKGETGEFTRMFQAASGEPPKAPPPPKPSQAEAGEFTRFFQGGLPPSQKPAPPSAERTFGSGGQERPSRGGGFVQRPNTPMPPPAKSSEPGEFTRLFSRPAPEGAKPVTPAPDLFGQSSDSRSDAMPDLPRGGAADLFEAEPRKATSEGPGEYTKIFGSGTAASPPQQPSTTAEPPQAPLVEDYGRATRPITSIPVAPAPASKGPSEYTMIVQGHRPPEDAGPAASSGPGPDQAGSAKPFPNLSAPPVAPLKGLHPPPLVPPSHPPQAKLPQAPKLPGAADAAKLASSAAPAAGNPNKKLILLLVVLGILAIILVVLVALAAKK